ncbi:MAG: hypothetical protein Q7T89_08740 [Anaerolineales bacterium]|nr:hypothetical protein [Anaerolineales bacterium]
MFRSALAPDLPLAWSTARSRFHALAFSDPYEKLEEILTHNFVLCRADKPDGWCFHAGSGGVCQRRADEAGFNKCGN